MSITHSLQYGILRLTIDRAERRNALTSEMFSELADELRQAALQLNVRVVLLKSAGSVFSAGADLVRQALTVPSRAPLPLLLASRKSPSGSRCFEGRFAEKAG